MALGKSLGNILGDYFGENPEINADIGQVIVQNVPMELITITRFQTRTFFDDESLISLSQSIKESGLIHPVLLLQSDIGYILISGERRLRSFQMLGLSTIPAIIKQKDSLTDKQQVLLTAVENMQRENLSPIEQAKTFDILMKTRNISVNEVAKLFNVTPQHISNHLKLLKASPAVQNALSAKKLFEAQARYIIQFDFEDQDTLLAKILEQQMTVKEVERLVKDFKNPKPKIEPKIDFTHDIPNHIVYQTEIIAKQFKGSKVEFKGSESKGRIVITW